MDKNLFLEAQQPNIMIIGSAGNPILSNVEDFSVSVVRYKLSVKFSQTPNSMDIWLYVDLTNLIVFATKYNKNQEVNPGLSQIQMQELLTPLLYQNNTIETVYNKSFLKPAPNNPRLLSYRWQKGQYKILLSNLKNFYKEKTIDLAQYMKNKQQDTQTPPETQANQETKTPDGTEQKTEPESKPFVINDETIKSTFDLIVAEFQKNGLMTGADITKANNGMDLNSLYAKYLSLLFLKIKENMSLTPDQFLSDPDITKITKMISQRDKNKKSKPSKGLIEKNYQIFSTINKDVAQIINTNKNAYFEEEISFYKELKNTDVFLENYLGK